MEFPSLVRLALAGAVNHQPMTATLATALILGMTVILEMMLILGMTVMPVHDSETANRVNHGKPGSANDPIVRQCGWV